MQKSETKQAHFGGQSQNGQKKQESHAQAKTKGSELTKLRRSSK